MQQTRLCSKLACAAYASGMTLPRTEHCLVGGRCVLALHRLRTVPLRASSQAERVSQNNVPNLGIGRQSGRKFVGLFSADFRPNLGIGMQSVRKCAGRCSAGFRPNLGIGKQSVRELVCGFSADFRPNLGPSGHDKCSICSGSSWVWVSPYGGLAFGRAGSCRHLRNDYCGCSDSRTASPTGLPLCGKGADTNPFGSGSVPEFLWLQLGLLVFLRFSVLFSTLTDLVRGCFCGARQHQLQLQQRQQRQPQQQQQWQPQQPQQQQ
jgi:hypothetical protein